VLRLTRRRLLWLDYPASARGRPRWGHGRPPHPQLAALIDSHREATEASLRTIASFAEPLGRIPGYDGDSAEPAWLNESLPALDGAALYTFVASRSLRQYVEIGSGLSTRFVARARRDHGRTFAITSIDPKPSVDVDAVCDHVVREPLELADLSLFGSLDANDVVFMDGTHYVFPDGDSVTFFLDVLPRLPAGVLVGIHDVMFPDDYGRGEIDEHWGVQYLLGAALLAGATRLRPVLPAWAISQKRETKEILRPLWSQPALRDAERFGSAFWLEIA
jgi:predicted O-methyltransferase YrrM